MQSVDNSLNSMTSTHIPDQHVNHCETDEDGAMVSDMIHVSDWRFGPAQFWYDIFKVPDSPEDFHYGFKLKANGEGGNGKKPEPYSDDAYLMVSQCHWEDNVVWDGSLVDQRVVNTFHSEKVSKHHADQKCATPVTRNGMGEKSPAKSGIIKNNFGDCPKSSSFLQGDVNQAPLLPGFWPENDELLYGIWEDEVIWDAKNMTHLPAPKIMTLDPNDENIILGIPEDVPGCGELILSHPHRKDLKVVWNNEGLGLRLENLCPSGTSQFDGIDPFNVSNDKFYMNSCSNSDLQLTTMCAKLIKHPVPVLELQSPLFPYRMTQLRSRKFHRPAMRCFSYGPLSAPEPHPVFPVVNSLDEEMTNNKESLEHPEMSIVSPCSLQDFTGKNGEMILVEFSEEHPPLMNQVGMCSVIMNYYHLKPDREQHVQNYRYGEATFVHSSPFLGNVLPGGSVQALENNMYRAPIYEHQIPQTDFIVIRTRDSYAIREADALFTAGQECPFFEVPSPHSKSADDFPKDLIQVFIYRLFWKSESYPKRININDVKIAFPFYSDCVIRNRLKVCAYVLEGDSCCWEIKSDFILPTEEEMCALVSPERCCAYYSMAAAQQRLEDAGYSGRMCITSHYDENDHAHPREETATEVLAAPWNTTRTYIQALYGKCILQLTGPADPTGCGEGFSYIRVPLKPTHNVEGDPKSENPSQKKTVTSFGSAVPTSKSIKRVSKMLQKRRGILKKSSVKYHKRYKEECQRIFDLQNHVLASSEVLSTDEDGSSSDDSVDLEELGRNVECLLSNGDKSLETFSEGEERERLELLEMIKGNNKPVGSCDQGDKDNNNNYSTSNHAANGRILKITRTFRSADGKEYSRVEVVRTSTIIDAYVNIRKTKDEAYIREFATPVGAERQKMLKERQHIRYQLKCIERNLQMTRRSERNCSRDQNSRPEHFHEDIPTASHLDPEPENESLHSETQTSTRIDQISSSKCGACGNVGHIRTNRSCPLFCSSRPAMTVEEEKEIEKHLVQDEDILCIDGTKLKLNAKLIKRAEELKRKSLTLKLTKLLLDKIKKSSEEKQLRLLREKLRSKNFNGIKAMSLLSSILGSILRELKNLPDAEPFLYPINVTEVEDYYQTVIQPMDLSTIDKNLREGKYRTRESFLSDLNQIVENTIKYNGADSWMVSAACSMVKLCTKRFETKGRELTRIEKAISLLQNDKSDHMEPMSPDLLSSNSDSDESSEGSDKNSSSRSTSDSDESSEESDEDTSTMKISYTDESSEESDEDTSTMKISYADESSEESDEDISTMKISDSDEGCEEIVEINSTLKSDADILENDLLCSSEEYEDD